MMSAIPRIIHRRRATITALPLYYSGPLLKKHKKEKDFKKYHGELRGTILFLYKDETQDTYTEKLDLEELKFMKLDSPYQRKMLTIFSLRLGTEEVQLKMDNPNTGEVWRGYILTVVNKEIPSKLQLLPGQLLQLQEVLAQERKRNQPLPHPPLPPRPSFLTSASPAPAPSSSSSLSPPPPINKPDGVSELPACFFNVTRREAEQMLEANPEYGDMIVRPSTLANNYALTLRQVTPRGPVMKNYRVTSTNSGFIIELDTAVRVSSLNDVLQYFLEKTEHRLHPFVTSQPYDTRIEVSPAPEYTFTPKPKTVPKAQVAPMLRSNTNKGLQLPTKPVGGEYVVPDDQSLELDQGDLDGGRQEVLKLRRETIYSTTDEEVTHYKNQMSDKSPPANFLFNF